MLGARIELHKMPTLEQASERLIRRQFASHQEACAARLEAKSARKQRDFWMIFAFVELLVIAAYAFLQFAHRAK